MSSYKSDVTLEEIRVKAIELNHRFFNFFLNISRIKFDYSKSSLYYGWELQLDNSKYEYMIKMDVGTLSKRYLWPRVLCHELLHVYTDMKGFDCGESMHSGKFAEWCGRIRRKDHNMKIWF